MCPPSIDALLGAWDAGRYRTALDRGLAMLRAAQPEAALETLAAVPIGERDRRLLAFREAAFGPRAAALAACPACAETLEMDLSLDDLKAPAVAPPGVFDFAEDGCFARFRLPTTADLQAAASTSDPARALFERCVEPPLVPEPLASRIVDRMAELDAQADLQLALVCPACSYSWQAAFDIVTYLWSELDAWAARRLSEVHELASAYGWSESEILSLPSARRDFYLELVRA